MHRHQPQPAVTRHDLIETAPTDEKVLVVVFLRGGADVLTLVPPVGDDRYHRARPLLGVTADDAVPLEGAFFLHKRLAALRPFADDGRLRVTYGAGSDDRTRSHFEAQDTMEHGGVGAGSGWLARLMQARGPSASALATVAIGTTRPESLRGAPGGAVMQSVRDFRLGDGDPALLEKLARLYAAEQGPVGASARATIDAVRTLRALRAETDDATAAGYPPTTFGRGLREVARLIRADVGLASTTIDLNGWDTHFVQAGVIGALIDQLGQGIDAFFRDLGPEGRRVTMVVMTEFGRRLRENSSFGTDHGAGSAVLVLGAAAAAQAGPIVRAPWATLSDAPLDEVGDLPASIDYRDVLTPVVEWHSPGVDLRRVWA